MFHLDPTASHEQLMEDIKRAEQRAATTLDAFDGFFDVIEKMRADKSYIDPRFENIAQGIPDHEPKKLTQSEREKIDNKLNREVGNNNHVVVFSLLNIIISSQRSPDDMLAKAVKLWPTYFDLCVDNNPIKIQRAAFNSLQWWHPRTEAGQTFARHAIKASIPLLLACDDRKVLSGINIARKLLFHSRDHADPELSAIIVRKLLALTLKPKIADINFHYFTICEAAHVVRDNPPLLLEVQKRSEGLLTFMAENDPIMAINTALKSAASILFSDQRAVCVIPSVHFANTNLPRLIGRDNKLALRGSAAAVQLSHEYPDLQKEAAAIWRQAVRSLISSDPVEIADEVIRQASDSESDRVATKESWALWHQVTREVFSHNPIHGVGMALYGVIEAERHMKMLEHPYDPSPNHALKLQSLPEQAHLGQIRGFMFYATRICGNLCDLYKRQHPVGAFNRSMDSYSYPDGADPFRRHPAINSVRGFRNSSIAVSCMAEWLKEYPRLMPQQKTAWKWDILL
jgi:hypothetical protein